ncbi:MAG: hypothetical protein AB7E96_10500 [Deferribacterales bacterium]
MKSGSERKLTGQVGEFLVCAQLGTMGYYASPYSGNMPGFDVTAVNPTTLKSFPIQVKTSNTDTMLRTTIDHWIEYNIVDENKYQFGEKKKLKHPNMIWILVQLKENSIKEPVFFICTEQQIQDLVINGFVSYMNKNGGRGPRGGISPHATLSTEQLKDFKEKWNLLDEISKSHI